MSSEVLEFLKKNPVTYLATVDKDGNPHVRPVTFVMEFYGRPYYAITNTKPSYVQIKAHPHVELASVDLKNQEWLRMNAKIAFTDDESIKNAVFDAHPFMKKFFTSWKDPNFEVFTLSGTATISGLSGKPQSYVLPE